MNTLAKRLIITSISTKNTSVIINSAPFIKKYRWSWSMAIWKLLLSELFLAKSRWFAAIVNFVPMKIDTIPIITVGREKIKIVKQYIIPLKIFITPTNLVHLFNLSIVNLPSAFNKNINWGSLIFWTVLFLGVIFLAGLFFKGAFLIEVFW